MTVLIVDDDENVLTALRLLLKSEGIACVTCRSPQQALEALRAQDCQLALVDLNYVEDTTSGKEGLRLITALRAADEELPIIAMTGWGTIGIAVEAMQRGAADFIEKPWKDNNRLLTTLRTQMKLRAAQGRSLAKRVAASPMPILITGENGTGKSLLAGYIHRHSPFAQGPFISVNMGALAESTFESEMFGHTRGAYRCPHGTDRPCGARRPRHPVPGRDRQPAAGAAGEDPAPARRAALREA